MRNTVEQQLPALIALAHDRTPAGRIVLAEKLADVFLSQVVALTAREEALVNELINDLLKNNDPSTQASIVERFAAAVNAPREVALRIVNGPLEIAAPALTANENFTDKDLIEVIDSKAASYAEAIARRTMISEAVADALVSTGDLRVMQVVAENLGAKLTGKALDVMVEAARLSAMLQKPIFERPELNADSAIRLYWWASQELRSLTLERFGFGPNKLQTALGKVVDDMLSMHALQKDDMDVMQDLASWIEDRGALNIAILPQLLRAGFYKLFNVAMSRLTNLDVKLVDMVMQAPGGRLLVALCRAIQIDKGNFISIFLMSRGGRSDDQIVHPQELSRTLAIFDRMTPQSAETLLNSWRHDPQDLIRRTQESAQIDA